MKGFGVAEGGGVPCGAASDQMPITGDPGRVKLSIYPGGHMFYSRGSSQAALRKDVMRVYATH